MATAIQFRRGTTAQHANFTGLIGEITVDTDLKTIRVHDGSTAAGTRLATYAEIQALGEGDITAVTAGNGLIGGGEFGSVTLNVGAGAGLDVNADNVAINTAYVRGLVSVTDTGGDGSLSYNNTTGVITYAGPDQTEANARIDARLSGGTGITYTSGVIATTITQYTDALARAAISVTDTGGDGSLSYNNTTGVITYTGPDQTEANARIDARLSGGTGITYTSGVIAAANIPNSSLTNSSITINGTAVALGGTRTLSTTDVAEGTNQYFTTARANTAIDTRLSGGTGVTYSSGVISIGQAVGTGDSVTFAGISGPLTGNVTGTVSSIANHSTTNLAEGTNLYFTAARTRGNVSATTASGISYDSGTGVFSLSTIPNSSLANNSITINGTAVALGGTRTLSTTDVAEGTSQYFTTARANTAIDAKLSGGTGVTYSSGVISIGQDVAANANVSFNRISNLLTPSSGLDAANKQYVDEVAQGLQARTAANALSDSNLSATYDNGTSGVGATLTATANGAFPTVDGITLDITTKRRLLVTGQTNKAHNGLYVLIDAGSAGTPWVLRRCVECDENNEIPGSFVFIKEGTTYGSTGWVAITPIPFTVGTTDISWTQFSGAGTFTAGNGLSLNGSQFNVNVAAAGGLEIVADDLQIKSSIAGTGLSYAAGVISTANIPNSSLANNSITINGTSVALGGTRTLSTTDIAEGTNLYFTAARARGNVSATTASGISYDSGTGVFSLSTIPNSSLANNSITINGTSVALGGTRTLSTSDVAEGTNQYFTTARANTAIDARIVGGNGLTYTSGNLNVGAGAGITVNADNVALTSGIVTAAAQSGGISAITVDTFGRVTSVTANAGYTTNTGTVTSVGGTGTVSGLTLTGTVTTSGSLTLGGTLAVAASDFASQTTKTFLAAPNATNGVPTFRTIVASDVPTLNQNTTGTAAGLSATLVATSGGTGQSVYAVGDLLFASTTTALSKLADVATGNALISGGVGVAPSYGKIGLTTHVSGTLPVANGGTGITSLGTGVATFLGTPTSANLAAAVTDETGTGALVFGTSPTFTTQISVPSIVKTGTSGTGNIGQSANTFNTVFAKATSAQYADLAERYEADTILDPGTVVCFGGDKEITVCGHENHHAVAGVISTDPAYMMNSGAGNDSTHPYVALTGRVPCKVVGPVNPGDLMVSSSVSGHAMANNNARAGTIIGKAIGKNQDGPGVIEVLITLM